jgi:hypothetical protein
MNVYTTYTRPLSVRAQYSRKCPIISSYCYSSSLVTWTVICLTAAKFKPLIFSVSGFALSNVANISIFIYRFMFLLYNLGSDHTENSSIAQQWTSTLVTYCGRLYLATGCLSRICVCRNVFTEPLLSSGWFLACDWRLGCRRYVVARRHANQWAFELPSSALIG